MNIVKFLSKTLFIPETEVASFINSAPHRYKQYPIPKRNGKGVRIIAQPARELKVLQMLALREIESFLPIHPAAMAYRKGIGIKENARMHAGNTYLLKMDFKDFFHSFTPADFIKHYFKHVGATDMFSVRMLSRLFFWSQKHSPSLKLSIGAPSSPLLSNTLMYEFDCRMAVICMGKGVAYTRYADDLTFTSNEKGALFVFPELVAQVCAEINYPRLMINAEKTVFSSKAKNRHVTGLTINNEGRISLGRERKRYIKSRVFKCLEGELNAEEKKSLAGLVSYTRHVEPSFFASLVKKYGVKEVYDILSWDDAKSIYPLDERLG